MNVADRRSTGFGLEAGRKRPPRALTLLRKNRAAMAGFLVLAAGLGLLFLAEAVSPYDPLAQSMTDRLRPPLSLDGAGRLHVLGTDHLGRDVLSRILWGTRVSLALGIVGVGVSAPVGVMLGLVAGYYGRWLDHLIMRVADIQLAFPTVLLAIGVVGVLGPELTNIVITLAISGWMVYARVVRSEVLSVKGREFVEAARVVGVPGHLILLRHVLPNVLSSVVVIATFATAHMILLESSLSFLGLGVQPPTPTWGGMLNEGRDYISSAWWLSVFPGLAITTTVLAINFVGDWVRDVMDPRFQPT